MGFFDKFKSFFLGAGAGNRGGSSEPPPGGEVSCREALEHLFEYLDGELEEVTHEQLADHFRVCEMCYPRLQFEEAFQKAVQRVQVGQSPPPSLREEVLKALEAEGLEGV